MSCNVKIDLYFIISTKYKWIYSHISEYTFIMSMFYNDQLTGSTANLMNLQCFFGRHLKSKNVRIVEPFLHTVGSVLGITLSPSFVKVKQRDVNTVKFSDIFDINEWTNYISSRKYAPLISWEDFIQKSPKQLILVHRQWFTKECDKSMINATQEFVTENKYKIVRQVCINFKYTGVLSPQQFLEMVYGPFKPSEVVVIFNRWGGIVNRVEDFRFSIKGTSCYRGGMIGLFHPSKQLLRDVEEYSKRFMNSSNDYMAVMIRVEYFAINHGLHRLSTEDQRKKLVGCFNSINDKVKSVMQERNISGKSLMMDIGKHGSYYFRTGTGKSPRLDMNALNDAVLHFFEIMYGKSFTQEMWEESYTSVAQFKAPGYIAIMQKQLAGRSTCLLLSGGGSFQGSAKTLYNELHHGAKCVLGAC